MNENVYYLKSTTFMNDNNIVYWGKSAPSACQWFGKFILNCMHEIK